jgi:hypothetical protein
MSKLSKRVSFCLSSCLQKLEGLNSVRLDEQADFIEEIKEI